MPSAAGRSSPVEPEIVTAAIVDEPAPVRGHTAIAWCVIVLLVSLVVVGMQLRPSAKWEAADKAAADHAPAEDAAADEVPAAEEAQAEKTSTVDDLLAIGSEIQGKFAIAMRDFAGANGNAMDEAQTDKLLSDLERALNTGPPASRLRYVVMTGELRGPQQGLDQLEALRKHLAGADHKFTPGEARAANALERLYQGYVQKPDGPSPLDPAQADELRSELGWFGRLALAPDTAAEIVPRRELINEARRTMLISALLVLAGFLVACVGFVILVTILVLAGNGTLRSGIVPSKVHPGIYAETFACWMLLFVGLNIAMLAVPLGDDKMWGVFGVQLLSLLLALCWPRLRGIGWGEIFRDAGIIWPKYAWLEPLRGMATYAMSLPILGVGLVVMFTLMQAKALFETGGDPFSNPDVPSHPIIELVRGDNPWIFWQILLVASCGAPVVEEIMFRGVLYRSLRDSSRWLKAAASILLSMAVSGFSFAVIHPQGWLGIPALGALATGFAIAREWRGSIWPSIFAHAINNGLVTLLLFSIVGA